MPCLWKKHTRKKLYYQQSFGFVFVWRDRTQKVQFSISQFGLCKKKLKRNLDVPVEARCSQFKEFDISYPMSSDKHQTRAVVSSSDVTVSEFHTLGDASSSEIASPLTNLCSEPNNIVTRSAHVVDNKVTCFCLCHSNHRRSISLQIHSTVSQVYQDGSSTEVRNSSGCTTMEERIS